jgi:hypothetical protein
MQEVIVFEQGLAAVPGDYPKTQCGGKDVDIVNSLILKNGANLRRARMPKSYLRCPSGGTPRGCISDVPIPTGISSRCFPQKQTDKKGG